MIMARTITPRTSMPRMTMLHDGATTPIIRPSRPPPARARPS